MGKFIWLVIAMMAPSAPTWGAALQVQFPGKSVSLTVDRMRAKIPVSTVEIDDPVYKTRKSFDAFALRDVLELAGWDGKSSSDEIVFVAADGYAPNMTFQKLEKHKGYLAFQEHGSKLKFGKVIQGKAKVSPAPFYVVWEEGAALEHEVPWAYQLVKIEIVDFAQKYPKLFPAGFKNDSAELRGFRIFKNECLRCHSLNLQGGDLGPELNVPKNVTEYWDKKVLLEFIGDASAFRARSKMPPFKNLTREQVEDLYRYLEAMKAQKSASFSAKRQPAATCRPSRIGDRARLASRFSDRQDFF